MLRFVEIYYMQRDHDNKWRMSANGKEYHVIRRRNEWEGNSLSLHE